MPHVQHLLFSHARKRIQMQKKEKILHVRDVASKSCMDGNFFLDLLHRQGEPFEALPVFLNI
jgi:hypothetical protein